VLLFVPKWKNTRPSPLLVRLGFGLSFAAGAVVLTSMLVRIELATGPNEAWQLGNAGISHTTYRSRSPHYSSAGAPTIRWQPCACPFGASYISFGRGAGFSSHEESRTTWPLLACTLLPTLVLRALRRQRIPPAACRSCGYNLTGNVSGQCPECGAPVTHRIGTQA